MNQNEFIIGDNLELESYLRQNINTLKDANIARRRQAAVNIHAKITEPNIAQSDSTDLILLKFGKDLLKSFSDHTEKCREFSIKSIKALIMQSEDCECVLPYVFAVLVDRSNCSDLEGIQHLPEVMRPPPTQAPMMLIKFIEESEEIRLLLVELLYSVLIKSNGDQLHEFIDDIVDILRAFLMDPFGDVQKMACKCLSRFCRDNHTMLLHFTEKMARAVLFPLISKKCPIRVAALDALTAVLLCGIWKHNAFVFEILTGFRDPNSVPIKAFYEPMHNVNYFATLIIDPKPQVREMFIKQIGFWLTQLADKWDHHPRMVPYVLSGLFDSEIAIQEAALQIIDDVGKQWEVEREKDIKDIKQLGVDSLWSLDGQLNNLPLPTPFKGRPNLGMRGFVKNQVRKMWPALYKEIVDLNEENRVRASWLTLMGVIFSEEYMTQFLDNFIPNTIIAINNENKIVAQNLFSMYELLGRFCHFKSYSFIIFQSIRGKFNKDEQYIKNAMTALQALCKGAFQATIGQLGDKIQLAIDVIDLLCEKEQIEYISSVNTHEVQKLLIIIIEGVQERGSLNEQEQFKECHIKLHCIANVIHYVANLNSVLLHTKIPKDARILDNQIRSKLKWEYNLTEHLSQQPIMYGNSNWKILISELISQFNNDDAYKLIEIIESQLNSSELPEIVDFITKLSYLLLQSTMNQQSLRNIIRLLYASAQWIESKQINQFNQKLLDALMYTQGECAQVLKQHRDIAKQLQKDQLTLQSYSGLIISLIVCKQKLYRKQFGEFVLMISNLCELLLPYPNSKHLVNQSDVYMLPQLVDYTFDQIDVLGENPNQETRRLLFSMLQSVYQYIPITNESHYQGDYHIITDFQKHLKKLIKYTIEEKDMETQDIYKKLLKELIKKCRQNFIIESQIAIREQQLSRVELLNYILQ